MKKENLIKSSFLWKVAFIVSILLFPTALLNAQVCQTVTFAQFNQTTGAQGFAFTNSSPVSSFSTVQGGVAVQFTYFSNVTGLPAELMGNQSARVFFNCQTSALGFVNVGRTVQPFNSTCTIQIIRDFPASVGNGSRTNLLTATIVNDPTTSGLSGDSGGNSAGYTATTPNQTITFSSDFVSFGATQARNLGLSFSSVNPNYSINPNGFLNSFTAAGVGTFASCPPPTLNPPTTAAAASVGGRISDTRGTGISRARISLTNQQGEIISVFTSSFGYYQLDDIPTGETYLVTINHRRYNFNNSVISLTGNVVGFNFTALE